MVDSVKEEGLGSWKTRQVPQCGHVSKVLMTSQVVGTHVSNTQFEEQGGRRLSTWILLSLTFLPSNIGLVVLLVTGPGLLGLQPFTVGRHLERPSRAGSEDGLGGMRYPGQTSAHASCLNQCIYGRGEFGGCVNHEWGGGNA